MKIQKNKDYNLITHWIYHFFISTKLLISLNLQIILFVLLIDLPRKNKKGFIWVSVAIVLFLWTNTILLAKRVLQKSAAFHVKMKKVLLILATFILSYALLYYSIYNYDKDSFYWLIDKKDEELEKKENEIYIELKAQVAMDEIEKLINLAKKMRKTLLETSLNSGESSHIGGALSIVDILAVLYNNILNINLDKPADRFILSKGHGCLALYSILADKNFFSKTEFNTFCKPTSILGGHPERDKTPGVEASTGALGHGMPMAVGMALAAKIKKEKK